MSARPYNAAIPGLANARASTGKQVVFVDNYPAFAKNPNYQTALKAHGLHAAVHGPARARSSFAPMTPLLAVSGGGDVLLHGVLRRV